MAAAGIGFGTSGLRGPASGFSLPLVAGYVRAFLETACGSAAQRRVAIGRDLRTSSPEIAALAAGALAENGWEAVNCGVLPTPALAAFALARNIPAIMVTGSHIAPDCNGLKFFRPEGELLKPDEAVIAARYREGGGKAVPLPPERPDALEDYCRRYTGVFASHFLKGLHVGVFAHSAAGRDGLSELLEALGARCRVFGRSVEFVAIDTEALEAEHLAGMRARGFDTVVSTDGDGDRPLLLDEAGRQVGGDALGMLTARALGAETLVVPVTASGAVEASGWFRHVIRTRVGSPYVVAAMAGAHGDRIAGFEANGGFLVQTPFPLAGGTLAPLPTRDAMLPLIAVLGECARRGLAVSELVTELPPRTVKAGRLPGVTPERGRAFVAAMANACAARAAFHEAVADPVCIDTMDGTRLTLADGSSVHFRQSGNAPELRCYAEAACGAAAERLLAVMMGRLARHFEHEDVRA